MVCLLRYAVRRRWSGTAYDNCASVWNGLMIQATRDPSLKPGPENGNPEAILPPSRRGNQFFAACHVDHGRGHRWQQPVLRISVQMDRTTILSV
jgi:hypothetical protein